MNSLDWVRIAHAAGHVIKDFLGYQEYRCSICGGPLPDHCHPTICCGTSLCPGCHQGWALMGSSCVICSKPKTFLAHMEG